MKYKFPLLLTVVALLTVACKEDFLDTDSPSAFTEDYIFSQETDAAKALYGVYAMFNQDAFTSRVSNNFTGNTDIECGSVGSAPDNSRRDIWSFEASDANADLLRVWDNAYVAINRANEVIEGIQNSPIYDDPNHPMMKQYLGEALTLRAIWYYLLMNHWGDVPFKTTPTKAGDNFYLPRSPRDSCLTVLIQDLVDIEADMMWADQLPYGIEQINREFVLGMIARLSLMRGGYWLTPDMQMVRQPDYLDYYTLARDYAKKLVDLKPHTLNPDFLQIFKNECEFIKPLNEDVLWEVPFYPGSGDVAWNNGIRVDAGTHPYGSGSNYLSFPLTYVYSFDTLDQRFDATCAFYYYEDNLVQNPQSYSSVGPGKWNRLWLPYQPGASSAKGTGINWPMMRYTDVLLMMAEAENELNGPTELAKGALRQVRQRAFDQSVWGTKVDAYISEHGDKESFFRAIVDERAWEFGGECLRKYDLARWNLYGEKVAQTRNDLIQMGKDAYAGVGKWAAYPHYLYYKLQEPMQPMLILNKFRQPETEPALEDSPNVGDNPDGWMRQSWLLGLYNTSTGEPSDYVMRQWRGYTDNTGQMPVRYILPLHSSTISSSQGVLQNNGYNYGE
ncbi:RagB/SusD family nutrient uptake outer membrane protein [Catalinimonas alkaloidigena]|nr:RagB/SusD family nutrient uptake outer membrane protein [Catalinimonas alkaloidigena]